MGGRGSRSSSGNGTGIASQSVLKNFSQATEDFNPNTVTMPTLQDVKNGNVLPKGGVAFSTFRGMTDDEKADVIAKALMVKPPIFLDDSGLQRLAYFTGMSDKPQIVTDAQIDKIGGTTLYRNVHDAYDKSKDIRYSSNDIYKQITTGDFTMYSDGGGSAHGKGIYFAESYRGATDYYSRSGGNNIMMRAKISSTAKTIKESDLNNLYNAEKRKNTKLYQAVSKADSKSARNLFALAKGYDVIIDKGQGSVWNTGYHMVLNRGALIMSDTIKATNPTGVAW